MKEKKEWRPLPDFITIKESKIEGLGIFATKDIKEGSDLGISHVYDKRFPDGYIRLPIGAFIMCPHPLQLSDAPVNAITY